MHIQVSCFQTSRKWYFLLNSLWSSFSKRRSFTWRLETWKLNCYTYIQLHVFRPAQDLSVWLGLTNRVLKIIGAELSQNNCGDRTKNDFVVIFIFQSARWINSEITNPHKNTHRHTHTHTHKHTHTHMKYKYKSKK